LERESVRGLLFPAADCQVNPAQARQNEDVINILRALSANEVVSSALAFVTEISRSLSPRLFSENLIGKRH
jgi:hypothetical protein